MSGLAIVPAGEDDEARLMSAAPALAATLAATLVETADPWVKVAVPRVSARLQTLTTTDETSLSDLNDKNSKHKVKCPIHNLNYAYGQNQSLVP